MTALEKVSIADIPARTSRRSKTSPLREAIQDLKIEEAVYVPYYDKATGEGFKPSTVAQVAGRMSKDSADHRYSVRSNAAKNGCYIVCNPKSNG